MTRRKHRPDDQAHHCDALRGIPGKQLTALSNVQAYFEGKPDLDHVGDVELAFADGTAVTLFLLSDGESVGAEPGFAEVPEPVDAGPFGRTTWAKENLLSKRSARHLAGARVDRIETMQEENTTGAFRYSRLSGWRFRFDNGAVLTFFNDGDDGKVLVDEEPRAVPGLETRFAPIPG